MRAEGGGGEVQRPARQRLQRRPRARNGSGTAARRIGGGFFGNFSDGGGIRIVTSTGSPDARAGRRSRCLCALLHGVRSASGIRWACRVGRRAATVRQRSPQRLRRSGLAAAAAALPPRVHRELCRRARVPLPAPLRSPRQVQAPQHGRQLRRAQQPLPPARLHLEHRRRLLSPAGRATACA